MSQLWQLAIVVALLMLACVYLIRALVNRRQSHDVCHHCAGGNKPLPKGRIGLPNREPSHHDA
jgi:hypothetical protein